MKPQTNNLLAIDASTQQASVALTVAGQLYVENIEASALHAKLLLPMIERLLTAAKIKINMLDGIVFGRGPGSFTGIRIACSIAKGLAFAHHLPLYGVSSLAAIAHHVFSKKENHAPVLAMMDARMNQVYWAFFQKNASESVEEFVTSAHEVSIDKPQSFILAGVELSSYKNQLSAVLNNHMIADETIYPESAAMLELVQLGVVSPMDITTAAPTYIRNQVTGAPRG